MRRFCGLTLSGPIPDESTILHFRHLLERHQLGEALLETINAHLAGQGLRLQAGTILDASIIAAPSSTKNQARQRDPRGIWSNRELMLVLDDVKEALFVYDLESGRLLAEHPLDKLNKSPRGIWSDGFTIWVSDDGAKRIFAYRLEDGMLVRHEDQEFTFRSLLKAGNGAARGIWSDGEVIFVADEQDDHVYTYNLPDAIDARLASLRLSDVEIDEFAPDRPSYIALAAADATVTTVEAIAAQETATVVIAPADADGDAENGHQVGLGAETEITITVTSGDGSRIKTYRIGFEKSPCLTGLTAERLSEVTFVGGGHGSAVDVRSDHGAMRLGHAGDALADPGSALIGLEFEEQEVFAADVRRFHLDDHRLEPQ